MELTNSQTNLAPIPTQLKWLQLIDAAGSVMYIYNYYDRKGRGANGSDGTYARGICG